MNSNLLLNLVFIILIISISTLFFLFPFIKSKERITIKEYLKNNKNRLCVSILFLIGFLSRIIFLDLLPGGINQDEASAGYDAYAIMKYGIDRNGFTYPVHLVSWGSGQNALYSYLLIPFLFIFGNNEISLRLPMAIIGCLSLYLLYKLLNNKFDKKTAVIGLFFLTICPWHIMKSRWALESNLFPDLVFFGVFFLINYLSNKKIYNLIISSLILGISAYSYGTSYFFLFFFVIIILIYLVINKKIILKHAFLCLSIVGIICIPIILFLYINLFDKESINILCFSIPKLNVNRFQSVTNIYSSSFFESAKENFKSGLYLLFNQNDNLPWNSIPYFGTIYLFSIPFTIIGVFHKNRNNKEFIWICRIWLIVSIAMLTIIKPNINRINIMLFPILIFTILGLVDLFVLSKKYEKILLSLYTVSYLLFISYYSTTWNEKLKTNFFYGLKEAILLTENIDEKQEIYITSKVNMPYIFVLYYTEYNVNDYIESVEYYNEGSDFEKVKSFSNYNFYLPATLDDGNVYIVSTYDNIYNNIDLTDYNVTYFGNYYVIDTTL